MAVGDKPLGQTTTFSLGVGTGDVTVLVNDKGIRDLLKKVKDLKPAMTLIGAAMMELVDNAFDTATGPEGRKWLPLKPSSIARREHGGDQPLQDTGVLRNSFRPIVIENGNAVSIGTNFGFYQYHQHDPDYPIDLHIIPIRNVLPIKHQPLPASWGDEIIATLEAHLDLQTGGSA